MPEKRGKQDFKNKVQNSIANLSKKKQTSEGLSNRKRNSLTKMAQVNDLRIFLSTKSIERTNIGFWRLIRFCCLGDKNLNKLPFPLAYFEGDVNDGTLEKKICGSLGAKTEIYAKSMCVLNNLFIFSISFYATFILRLIALIGLHIFYAFLMDFVLWWWWCSSAKVHQRSTTLSNVRSKLSQIAFERHMQFHIALVCRQQQKKQASASVYQHVTL